MQPPQHHSRTSWGYSGVNNYVLFHVFMGLSLNTAFGLSFGRNSLSYKMSPLYNISIILRWLLKYYFFFQNEPFNQN